MIETSQERGNRMLAEHQAERARARSVNHAHPFCDQYCRCRRCKPPMIPNPMVGTVFALIVGLSLVLAAIVVRVFD